MSDRSTGSFRLWGITTLGCGLGLLAIVLLTRPPRIVAPWDTLMLLDGGYDIYRGLVPHLDFYNPIGALASLIISLGMRLTHPSLEALVIGNAIFCVVLASWAWWLGCTRLSAFNAFLLTAFVALLILAPRPLGYDFANSTYAMIYNRYGWALLGLLIVQLFIPRSDGGYPHRRLEEIAGGIILGLLLYAKVNYFGVGLAAIVLSCLLSRTTVKSLLFYGLGWLAVCLGIYLLFNISLIKYAADIQTAARVQSYDDRVSRLLNAISQTWQYLFLIVVEAWAIWTTPRAPTDTSVNHQRLRVLAILGFVVCSAYLITASNTGEAGQLPLFFIAGLIGMEFIIKGSSVDQAGVPLGAGTNYLLCALIVIPTFFASIAARDACGILYSAYWNEISEPKAGIQRFDAAPLADFIIPPNSNWRTAYWRAKDVPSRIDEGLKLLRAHISDSSRLFVVAECDPFSMALGITPPKGTPLWWDLDLSFSDKSFPDPKLVFAQANLVMVPLLKPEDEGCCKSTVEKMMSIYGDYIQNNFSEMARSDNWELLARTP